MTFLPANTDLRFVTDHPAFPEPGVEIFTGRDGMSRAEFIVAVVQAYHDVIARNRLVIVDVAPDLVKWLVRVSFETLPPPVVVKQ